MKHPHDRLFRGVFSDPEHARGLLRANCPEPLSRAIDWSTLTQEPGAFVDHKLAELRSDVLFSVTLRGRKVLLYLLVEHQSSPDDWMLLRLLGYLVRIWEEQRKLHPGERTLRPIIPLVVFHHEDDSATWSKPTAFHQLFDLPQDLRELLQPYLPDFSSLLDDLTSQGDEDLRARAITALASVTLFCLKRARSSSDIVSELERWADRLTQVADAPNGSTALVTVLRYILEVTNTRAEHLVVFARKLGPKAEEAMITGADILRAEGEAKGKAEGKAEDILDIFEARGLAVSAEQRRTILGTSDVATLRAWLKRAVTCPSADDIFRD